MRVKKKFKSLFVCFIIFNLYKCDSSSNYTTEITQKKDALSEFLELNLLKRVNGNKLVFRRYFLSPDSNITRNLNSVIWFDSTTNVKQIEKFTHLFTEIKDEGYCCCPTSHYSVTFYKDTSELGIYFVDTLTTKDKAMFYDGIFQTSYYIDLKAWNSFLKDDKLFLTNTK